MVTFWQDALGADRTPSDDQRAAILAPATGRHSVNAGAGTGKTATLALRALYLIESAMVSADAIVVMTFTKKAAAEIGGRIADTLDRATAAGARLSHGGDGVRCTTIHGLAAEILREFAFDFGLIAAPRAIADGEAYAIFHATFGALLDRELAVDTGAFPIGELDLAVLERDLAKLALHLKNHGISPETFEARALAQTERFERQTWGQLWNYGNGRNSASRIALLPKEPQSTSDIAREATRERANVRVVAALLREFDRRLSAAGAATYGDLIAMATDSLLKNPEIARRLRARWRYLLLDESQDTSALQLAFIETVFGKPGEHDAAGMMPVGDTRQAIYGFNGADEHVMERLATTSDGRHPLVLNRRSPQEIVDAGHAVLAELGVIPADMPKLEASAGSGGLTSVRVENFVVEGGSIKEHVELEAAAIAREILRLLEDPAVTANDVAILVRRRTHAAAYVSALNARGIAATLDRRSGLFVAPEIRDALAWLSLLLDLHDASAAVRILQSALVGLCDAATIALTARRDWLPDFLRDRPRDDLDADTRARLRTVRELIVAALPSVGLPLVPALAYVLERIPIAASYMTFGEATGAQTIANLRSLQILAAEFSRDRPGARLHEFAEEIALRIRFDDDPQEAELDHDGVRVLTIHQAKGLEWPFVFVACATKNQYASAEPSDRVVNYDRTSGAFALKADIDGCETFRWLLSGCEHDPATGERIEPPNRKLAADRESARIFYVALTRAKKRVYVSAPAKIGALEAPYLAILRAWAAERDRACDLRFDAAAAARSGAVGSVSSGTTRVAPRTPQTTRPLESSFRPRISFSAISAFETCPRMARLRYRLFVPDLRADKPRFVGLDDGGRAPSANAARLGSLAHRALEIWGRATLATESIAIGEASDRAGAEFTDATTHEIRDARACAERAVEALASYIILAVEEPFEISFGETRVEGAIDLVARDRAGRIVVVDYKTGRTDDARYALQLALYCRAARRRFGDEGVAGAILRLTAESATMTFAKSMSDDDLELAVARASLLESDVPSVGGWCTSCAYRGAPCMAPLA